MSFFVLCAFSCFVKAIFRTTKAEMAAEKIAEAAMIPPKSTVFGGAVGTAGGLSVASTIPLFLTAFQLLMLMELRTESAAAELENSKYKFVNVSFTSTTSVTLIVPMELYM